MKAAGGILTIMRLLYYLLCVLHNAKYMEERYSKNPLLLAARETENVEMRKTALNGARCLVACASTNSCILSG
jgi:hypothetical protein